MLPRGEDRGDAEFDFGKVVVSDGRFHLN
jgi:hypothetical protein